MQDIFSVSTTQQQTCPDLSSLTLYFLHKQEHVMCKFCYSEKTNT